MKTKDYLIGKYYDGDTTAEEETTLRMMLADDDSADGRLLRAFEEIYDMAAPAREKPLRRCFSGWSVWVSSAAAAIAVLATIGAAMTHGGGEEPFMADMEASYGAVQGSGARVITDPDEAMTMLAGAMAMAQSRIDAANEIAFRTIDRVSMTVNASIENQISSIPNFRQVTLKN